MEALKSLFIVIAAALSACAGTVVLKAAGGTAYYYGQVSFFSPEASCPITARIPPSSGKCWTAGSA